MKNNIAAVRLTEEELKMLQALVDADMSNNSMLIRKLIIKEYNKLLNSKDIK